MRDVESDKSHLSRMRGFLLNWALINGHLLECVKADAFLLQVNDVEPSVQRGAAGRPEAGGWLGEWQRKRGLQVEGRGPRSLSPRRGRAGRAPGGEQPGRVRNGGRRRRGGRRRGRGVRQRERRGQAEEARPQKTQNDRGARGAFQVAPNEGEHPGAHTHARSEFCAGQSAQSRAVLLQNPKAVQDRDAETG